MLSLNDLAIIALAIPALTALACTASLSQFGRDPGWWARLLLRVGMAATLADVLSILGKIQPDGILSFTLWGLVPHLPLTLQVDTAGCIISALVLSAALVVSFTARDQHPLASACLALACLGGVWVALAGGLVGIFVGLQLSAAGGIGLSYARHPRVTTHRMIWAVVADQVVGLIWLGSAVALLNQWGTLQLAGLPTAAISPAVAALLLLPAAVRLGASLLLSGRWADPEGQVRAQDVADWLSVVAIPTALILLIRVQQLAGGAWPAPWFGTLLDLVAIGAAAIALLLRLSGGAGRGELRLLVLGSVCLVLAGFGENTASGTLLALSAGFFLEVATVLLARALLAEPKRGGAAAPSQLRPSLVPQTLGNLAALLPLSLGFTLALTGLMVATVTGLALGLLPALAYLMALMCLILAFWGGMPLARPRQGGWIMALPAAALCAAALFPGWVVADLAPLLAPPGTLAAASLSAPNPLSVRAGELLWPGGYLALIVVVAAVAWAALRVASGEGAGARLGAARLGWAPEAVGVLASFRGALTLRGDRVARGAGWATGWYRTALTLAERELSEHPVWLWLALTAAAGWMLAELTHL